MTFRRFAQMLQVMLVVILGRVKGHYGTDLRGGMVAHLHQLAENLEGGVALGVVVEPNGGEILCPDVYALAIHLLKVVDFKEIAHQGLVGNLFGVVCHFNGLQMSRRAGFHLFVAWVLDVAAHEADDGLRHAFQFREVILHAPKATC